MKRRLIRDVILPGDMKDLMNKVTEAKKAAEANLIVRRGLGGERGVGGADFHPSDRD